jgi:hypothetical protein
MAKPETEARIDPLNPAEDVPSALDDRTHAEFLAIYRDASENIRFAKVQQWRSVSYFSAGAIAVTVFGHVTDWQDTTLTKYLLAMVWIFSLASIGVILSLQWWQGVEHAKIDFLTSRWGTFSAAARRRKSKLMSDIQRYGMLSAMILYLELATIAVTKIFLTHL